MAKKKNSYLAKMLDTVRDQNGARFDLILNISFSQIVSPRKKIYCITSEPQTFVQPITSNQQREFIPANESR
jgi:hypothetical protein